MSAPREFVHLQDLLDYIPNCIICGKPMQIKLNNPYGKTIALVSRDGFVVSREFTKKPIEECSVVIDPLTNKIIKGATHIDNMLKHQLYVYKKCRTCRFIISLLHEAGSTKYPKFFPSLPIVSEHIEYRRKKSKEIDIQKFYTFKGSYLYQDRLLFVIDGKQLTNIRFDDFHFNKIKNLKHLNRQIKTILTFQ